MKRMYEVKCENCHDMFSGDKNLNKHICRIHLSNPSDNSLYMKNWYVNNECIWLFCSDKKEQIATLHSDQCLKSNPCPDKPNIIANGEILKDKNDILHILGYVMKDNKTVDWEMMNNFIFVSDHQKFEEAAGKIS